jgi:hypothetical protein
MALGTSILLIAVHVSTKGFNLHTIGIILIVAGIAGLVISLLTMTLLTDRRRRRAVVYDERVAPPTRRVP